MKVRNTTRLAYGYKATSRRPPQPEMALVVRGRFQLVSGGVVTVPHGRSTLAQGSVTGDVFDPDDLDQQGELLYPSDLADFKENAEVMVRGTCHVPRGEPVPMCPVQVRVGAWSKMLRVVGPRVFNGSSPSKPAPFDRMPIGMANAYGGPGYAPNPVGKGYGTIELPNVEGAREPIQSKGDRPTPEGFGARSANWPDRKRKFGTGKSKRRGLYPDAFDWTYFHAAPPDQQLEGYLRGDEEISFQNLHPEHAILTTRLPSLRVRAFVKDVGGRFREVKMVLDTLFADLDKSIVSLVWRGVDAVGEADLSDVATVLFASEPLASEPESIDKHKATLEAFEKDPHERLDEVLDPEHLAVVAQAKQLAAEKGASIGRQTAEPHEPLPPDIARRLEGIDPRARAALAPRLANVLATGKRNGRDLSAAILVALGSGDGAKAPATARREQASSIASLKKAVTDLRQKSAAAGRPTAELDRAAKALEDPRLAALPGAQPPPPPGPGVDLSGQDLAGADLSGVDLSGANLERAILSGANLKGANLEGARLARATLAEADLTDANLAGADLTEAMLIGARAQRARLDRANLTRTIFEGADLTGASLVGATGASPVFTNMKLVGATLANAHFTKIVANRAELDDANLAGAELPSGVLSKCSLKRANLEGALLVRTSFFGSDLSDAKLGGARGEMTNFGGADLARADLRRAVLPSALFNDANAKQARFFGADLRNARFDKAELQEAELIRANLHEAQFQGASLERASLVEANLYDARLTGIRGERYDLTGANLKRAIVEAADAPR